MSDDERINPAKPDTELLKDLAAAIVLVRDFLDQRGAPFDDVIRESGFKRNAAIVACKEAVNENDETRKRFEVMCREVFKKFKACINVQGVNTYRTDRDAINIIYKSLQKDKDEADISGIIRQLHQVVDEAIEVQPDRVGEESSPHNISRIDFDRLKQEFGKSRTKHTTVQAIKNSVEKKLQRLLAQNPLRADLQKHYEEIVAAYNREKDRVMIEQTFEALLKLAQALDDESCRAVREGLDEESLAIFDLLKKPDLSAAEIKQIKEVSVSLLEKLKAKKLRIDQWRDKEATRNAVRVTIRDFLWDEQTGLPIGRYVENEVNVKAEDVFRHIYRAYPSVPSLYYVS